MSSFCKVKVSPFVGDRLKVGCSRGFGYAVSPQFANGDPVATIEVAYPSLTETQIDMRSILTSDHLTPSVARYLPVPTASTLGFGFPLRGIPLALLSSCQGCPLALPG